MKELTKAMFDLKIPLEEKKITNLIKDIKRKKELSTVSDDFVQEQLFRYLQQEPKQVEFLAADFSIRSAQYKKMIKEVRKILRQVYGLFRIEEGIKQRRALVEKLIKTKQTKIVQEILATHSSTKERLPFYEKLYQKIFKITGKPKSIIDLGCGINPFSYPLMKLRKVRYAAYDISDEETYALQNYFNFLHKKNSSFQGTAEVLDILHWEQIEKLAEFDLCLMFKMTDVLDRGKGHKATELVIRSVPARFVVVSFPTKTMGGKKMNFPRRKWIELMCKRLDYKFKMIKFSNELFYVIEK